MAQGESKRENPPEIPTHKLSSVQKWLNEERGKRDGFPGIRLPRFEKIEKIGKKILGEENGCVGASEKPKFEHLRYDAADEND